LGFGRQSSEDLRHTRALNLENNTSPSHELGKTWKNIGNPTQDHLSAPETLEKPWSLKRCGS